MNQLPKAIRYRKPPIIERVATVTADITEENFVSRFESWKTLIEPEFPQYDPIKNWKLNIRMKDDVPVLDEALPEVQVTHRFWKLNDKGRRFTSMRLLPNRLTINLHPEPDKHHNFEELVSLFGAWFPRWLSHFGGNGCESVELDYINLLSRETTPGLISSDGGVMLGGVLNVFTGPPGRFDTIIPPYDCVMGLMVDPQRVATLHTRVAGLPPQQGGGVVRVDFRCQTIKQRPTLTQHEVLAEVRFLHNIVIEQFEALFTEAAKKTFEPE